MPLHSILCVDKVFIFLCVQAKDVTKTNFSVSTVNVSLTQIDAWFIIFVQMALTTKIAQVRMLYSIKSVHVLLLRIYFYLLSSLSINMNLRHTLNRLVTITSDRINGGNFHP